MVAPFLVAAALGYKNEIVMLQYSDNTFCIQSGNLVRH
jgi:hypothetical protein